MASLEFDDLPLVEVALRHTLKASLPVVLPFVLDLREKVRGEFPVFGDIGQIEVPPGPPVDASVNLGKVNGAVFVREEDGVAVSVQENLLSVRWMRRVRDEYPRFSALLGHMALFRTAIGELVGGTPLVSVANMAYANKVNQGAESRYPEPWPFAPGWTQPSLMTMGRLHGVEVSFQEGKFDARANIAMRDAGPDSDNPWYLLLSTAGAWIEDGADPMVSSVEVHDYLNRWFEDLISDEAKAAWKLRRDDDR